MQLQLAVHPVFEQLTDSIKQLTSQEYIQPCRTLSHNSVGQHVRHIIELFQCLENGYLEGKINYEKRKRDLMIETDKEFACLLLTDIEKSLDKNNKELLLEAVYDGPEDQSLLLPTNYFREIAYNLEHTIHHMALIRVGITEINSNLMLPETFGIASSTLKHRRQCAR